MAAPRLRVPRLSMVVIRLHIEVESALVVDVPTTLFWGAQHDIRVEPLGEGWERQVVELI